MAAKKFIIPFAATGDKAAVPNTLQPDGTVSYAQGFGPDYELDKTLDPINAKDVPRDQTNQIYFDLTDAVGEQQLYGVALWGADRAPYPLNARAYHNDKLWRSSVINNSGEPGVSGWDDASMFADTINAPLATVAAAANINLTTGAPDTSQIAISGTGVNINGFTVAADRFFVVKMTGASNTLVDSASLVTGRGRNISVVAGDSFLMRSTAANTVEIIGFCENPVSTSRVGISANGWVRLESGIIIQWGSGSYASGSTVAFPQAFPNACFSVVASHGSPATGPTTNGIGTKTNSNFVIFLGFASALWIAIGY